MTKLPVMLLAILAINTCNQAEEKCPDKPCTMMFASVPVSYNKPVKDFKAVNLRTGQNLTHQDQTTGNMFTIVDDGDRKKLTEGGDDIELTATDSATNVSRKDTVKISGGKCACHVERVSGPTEISFK
ncbi:hypothetical protein [Mucilaginibacter defluvii]|uniref:Uncharacterized protein n=1 Tax=Mucilaginibacter defluvii TaxID=1196019 RepID=A0ABP9FZ41_9SPHI